MKTIDDLLEQLETIRCNVINAKMICTHPIIQIIELQLKDAIEMADELASQGGDD